MGRYVILICNKWLQHELCYFMEIQYSKYHHWRVVIVHVLTVHVLIVHVVSILLNYVPHYNKYRVSQQERKI